MKDNRTKKIAIIGGGFTGLTAAYRLAQNGFDVTIFEAENELGGLAMSFDNKNWGWPLEKHYHHLFVSDKDIQELAAEIGHTIDFKRPITATLYDWRIRQLDSPLNLLKFSEISIIDRLRTGLVIGYLKLTTNWRYLENITVEQFLKKWMGERSWLVLWEPLMFKKFNKYYNKIPASWFWARIKVRSASLGYPRGGFASLTNTLIKTIKKQQVTVHTNSQVSNIKALKSSKLQLTVGNKRETFDKVICTLPTPIYLKITSGLPKTYLNKYQSLVGLGAINLVLALNKRFLDNNTYWLNINDKDIPFLCLVEHTNFVDKKHYKNQVILYIGNYLERNESFREVTKQQLLNRYYPYLKKINIGFNKDWIIDSWMFKADFAQPVVSKNYSKNILELKTPIKNLYLANMQQVYPWDRGTNYAVELGNRVAKLVKDEDHG